MQFYGLPSWPPKWVPIDQENQTLIGEIGTLTRVSYSTIIGYCCHLYIEHEGRNYIGTILIDDQAFCRQLFSVLHHNTNRSIEAIGSLDLSYTL